MRCSVHERIVSVLICRPFSLNRGRFPPGCFGPRLKERRWAAVGSVLAMTKAESDPCPRATVGRASRLGSSQLQRETCDRVEHELDPVAMR